jgi:hyperosmotically inducible protein
MGCNPVMLDPSFYPLGPIFGIGAFTARRGRATPHSCRGMNRVWSSVQTMKNKNISALLVFIAGPIALFASSETDNKIEDAAKASYNYQTVLENHVKVKAKDGVVTLSGTVQDKDERNLAVDTVENLPGVVAVNNEIKVEPTHPEKSDGWIAVKIRSHLLTKANVSVTSTKVVVNDGHVVLSGTADNIAQKDLTALYAKDIDGVKSVKNEIVIKDAVPSTMSEKIDDASITSQVKYALLSHKSTSALKTKVTTNEGVITVTGEASSAAEKSMVSKLAGDVRGVKSVNNSMTVKS